MRKAMASLAVFGLLATGGLTACTDEGDSAAGGAAGNKAKAAGQGKVGVILPDTTSSARWENDDRKYLQAAFDKAGVPVEIVNAEGDEVKFLQTAERMIAEGVRVLMITNMDPQSAKASLAKARAAGVKTIDYDRLSLNGAADYYVSFDNRQVGVLQGQELVNCLRQKNAENPVVAELNGSPTDNNATEFKNGYDSILQPMYDDSKYTKGPDQWVPGWKGKEGAVIFAQMLQQQPKIAGVLAANDELAHTVIQVLKKKGMNGRVPVTGQDATVQGLQNILAGDQCMTVFKNTKPEAEEAAGLAIKLYNGEQPKTKDQQKDVESGAYVPFVKLVPLAVTIENIDDVIKAGYADRAAVCKGEYERLCKKNNI